MSSPLFDALGGFPMFGNMQNFKKQFEQFKSQFQGDPQQRIQEMLNSGQITQEQVNKASQIATQIQNMMR